MLKLCFHFELYFWDLFCFEIFLKFISMTNANTVEIKVLNKNAKQTLEAILRVLKY
jgi:hypothetical protein